MKLNPEELNQVAGGGILDWIKDLPKPNPINAGYYCEICGLSATFTTKAEYKEHMKSVHNINKQR